LAPPSSYARPLRCVSVSIAITTPTTARYLALLRRDQLRDSHCSLTRTSIPFRIASGLMRSSAPPYALLCISTGKHSSSAEPSLEESLWSSSTTKCEGQSLIGLKQRDKSSGSRRHTSRHDHDTPRWRLLRAPNNTLVRRSRSVFDGGDAMPNTRISTLPRIVCGPKNASACVPNPQGHLQKTQARGKRTTSGRTKKRAHVFLSFLTQQ